MDYLALAFAVLAVLAGLLSMIARPPFWATAAVAVALLSLALICQFTDLTGYHATVTHH